MYIVVDIGGTNIRVAASKNGRAFFSVEKFKTPKKFEQGLAQIVGWAKRVQKTQKIKGVTIAVPSTVSDNPKVLLNFPNLPGWRGYPLKQIISRDLHTKTVLLNDAAAAGLGEALRGAGKNHNIIAYITISTGIGGARIKHGRVDGAAQGFEPGHQILIPNGRRDSCGQQGCFEAYASGTGFYKTYGLRPENCKDKKIWARHAQIVGWGLINTIVHWSPDIVILGGGLTQTGSLFFKPLRAYVRKHLKILKSPPIVPAKLGDNAGLYGALALLHTNVK